MFALSLCIYIVLPRVSCTYVSHMPLGLVDPWLAGWLAHTYAVRPLLCKGVQIPPHISSRACTALTFVCRSHPHFCPVVPSSSLAWLSGVRPKTPAWLGRMFLGIFQHGSPLPTHAFVALGRRRTAQIKHCRMHSSAHCRGSCRSLSGRKSESQRARESESHGWHWWHWHRNQTRGQAALHIPASHLLTVT